MNNPFNDKINKAVAEAARKVMEQTKKAEQMSEEYVIHKGKHEPGRVSSLGGQTLHGVTVKDVYTDKKEAQADADKINAGRGYKPGDEKNSLYGGVLYQVSPRKSMKEEAEQIDELSDKTKTAYAAAAVADAAHKAKLASTAPQGSKMKAYADAKKKARLRGLSRPQMQANEEVNHFTLHAVHDERGTKKKLGSFASKAEAAAHINKLENSGKFPEGHEAVLTCNKTGEKHTYTDKWEKLDEGRNIFEAEEHVEVKNYPHLHDFVHGSGSANSGESREDSGKIKVKKSHAEKAEEALKKAKQKGMDLHGAGGSADDGEDYHEGHKIPSHALRILDKYVYEEFQQIDEAAYMGKGNHKPGWMLRADPELAKAFEAAKKRIEDRRARQAKWAGVSIPSKSDKMEEEVEQIDERGMVGMVNKMQKNASAFKAGGGIAAARSGPISPEHKAAYVKAGRDAQKHNPSQPRGSFKALSKEETSHIAERLIGKQHKIDANKNGKIDAHDFKLLRKKSKMVKESVEPLAEEATPALSAAMKAILADAFHMYFKAHTFHWNVEGANFPEYHKFFGDVYEQLFDTIDPIAEEIRALGEYAPRSLTELKGSTSIDDSSVQTPAEMFASLLADNSKILAGLTNGYKVAEAAGEIGLSNFLQDKIDAHKKLGWMIKSVSKGA